MVTEQVVGRNYADEFDDGLELILDGLAQRLANESTGSEPCVRPPRRRRPRRRRPRTGPR
jgi:hypothetical protein